MVAYSKFRNLFQSILKIFFCISIFSINIYAQRNGDILAFQGLDEPNDLSAKALALGRAFTAATGDLGSIFYNPAGLAKINKLQISASVSYNSRMWRDNQIWYPGGSYSLLPEYMENLYTPPARFNGIWSDSLGNPFGLSWDPADFRNPVEGADSYSAEAADAETTINKFGLSQLAVAYPVQLFDKNFVVAAAYNANYNPVDYDWNGDHLDPHWGTSFDFTQLALQDSIVRSNWDIYTRQRSKGIQTFQSALAFQFTETIQLGIGLTSMFGSTDDNLTLNRIGYYQFVQTGTMWSFTYDTLLNVTSGTSKFSSFMFNIGGMLTFDNLNIGFNINLPYTITREWNYNNTIATNKGTTSSVITGIDKMKIPICYNVGIKFMPSKNLSIYTDLTSKPYSKAKFESTTNNQNDSNFPVWVNQYTIAAGIEYRLQDDISLLIGYSTRTTGFVPYGVAIRDAGFPINSYTAGLSYNLFMGRIDFAYELRNLKYYDTFYSSRNYTLVTSSNFLIGYTFSL
jgi:hypothetical protein